MKRRVSSLFMTMINFALRRFDRLQSSWAIDKAAYGEASITYEHWWTSFPLGLWALFYQKRVMGAIGIWPLSSGRQNG